MELERAGIVGQGLSFSKQEKDKARGVEFHFYGVQNVRTCSAMSPRAGKLRSTSRHHRDLIRDIS